MVLILVLLMPTRLMCEDCKTITHYEIFAVKLFFSMVSYGYAIQKLS